MGGSTMVIMPYRAQTLLVFSLKLFFNAHCFLNAKSNMSLCATTLKVLLFAEKTNTRSGTQAMLNCLETSTRRVSQNLHLYDVDS